MAQIRLNLKIKRKHETNISNYLQGTTMNTKFTIATNGAIEYISAMSDGGAAATGAVKNVTRNHRMSPILPLITYITRGESDLCDL